MKKPTRILAVIPARGGSKGLPGKNTRSFAGLPLIAHTILYTRMCPEISRCIVSTDSEKIADVSRQFDADVPFIRPDYLAQDDTAMGPVLKHALEYVEGEENQTYDLLLHLDPTSPAREPSDVTGALKKLEDSPQADGVIGVSEPDFNPTWHCVIERDGWVEDLITGGSEFDRRQQVAKVYRINGSINIWRASFIRSLEGPWRQEGRHVMFEIPDLRAMSFDTLSEFQRAEVLVHGGLIKLPWMQRINGGPCET